MDNKGFTLVELLAVVALISILSGIAVMSVSKNVVKSKRKTYELYEKNLKSAAINYMSTHTEESLVAANGIQLSAEELIKLGYLESMTDPNNKSSNCNNNSYVKVNASYQTSSAFNMTFNYKICLICNNYKSSTC